MTAFDAFVSARNLLLTHRRDYLRAYREFAWPSLTTFNWGLDYFDRIAVGNETPALWIVNESGAEHKVTYSQMSARSNQVATWLRSKGISRGDRVLLMLGNEPALWESLLALIKLGALIIPCSTLLTSSDVADRMRRGGVTHIIVRSADAWKFQDIAGRYARISVGSPTTGWDDYAASADALTEPLPGGITQATDPLLLYFTSGTTSKPKLVVHTHQSYPIGHLSTMYWIGLQPGDIHLNISSPGWAKHAWSCVFAPWNAGACAFVYDQSRFDATKTLGVLQRCGVTTMCAPPTVWRMMIQEDLCKYRETLSLRELVAAGEPLNPEVIDKIQASWGLAVRDGFGQTETTALIGNTPGQRLKPGSMGRPLPGYSVTLEASDKSEATDGEICVRLNPRPVGVMSGYLDEVDKTAEAMQGGLYHTSDVATRDNDGYITYIGRRDDVFKASDYRISPFELESLAIEHEAVVEAAVVPSPDAVRLAVPKLFVALRAGYSPSKELAGDILAFMRGRVAPYKRIRRLEFIDLPKTISGKIRRAELRALEAARNDSQERKALEFWEEDFPIAISRELPACK